MPRLTSVAEEHELTRSDIEACVGGVHVPPEERTGVVYYSGEEFLDALKACDDSRTER